MGNPLNPWSGRRHPDAPSPLQRVAAVAGLVGLVSAWLVLFIPCALYLAFSLIPRRREKLQTAR